MKTGMMAACLAMILAGCANPSAQSIPLKQDLLAAASVQGRYRVEIEEYDANEMIAVVRTPGWEPETKPYQFDGKQWVPLWSPYEAPEVDNPKKVK
jgi:hypothetical protein